jgi:hypothetical protein
MPGGVRRTGDDVDAHGPGATSGLTGARRIDMVGIPYLCLTPLESLPERS